MFHITFNIIFLWLIVPILANDCLFEYASDFPRKEPVLLRRTTAGPILLIPENNGVVLEKNQKIYLSGPGERNQFEYVTTKLIEAKCVVGQILSVKSVAFVLDELGCKTTVTGEFKLTSEQCGNSGFIIYIGHFVENKFHKLFNVCYDDNIGGTLYAHHIIYGSAIKFSGNTLCSHSFKVGGLAPGISASVSYEQKTQKNTFKNLLGTVELADEYINDKSYFAKGHLAPDKDMVFVSSQCSTYFYINSIPQWQQINNGNWKSLELSLRSVAAKLKENFQVFTGSHEVLQLPDKNNNLVEIYLSGRKLPVPKFVWKVFYSIYTKKAIAFVSINNPFVNGITSNLYLCNDICDQYGWGTPAWENTTRGLLYCCEVNKLREKIGNVPELEISGVQRKIS